MDNGWTFETFKHYVDELRRTDMESVKTALTSQEKLNKQALDSNKEAVIKAEAKQDQYNHSHNDLLKKMEDMMPRKESDAREKNYDDKIENIRKEQVIINSRLDIIAGRGSGIQSFIGWIIAAIAIIGFILAMNKQRDAQSEGKNIQSGDKVEVKK